MAKINLSPPWIIYYREIEEMFKFDPEVRVLYNNDEYEVRLYVENAEKAEALSALIPREKEFGNITMKVNVVPANEVNSSIDERSELFKKAFKGNGALSYITDIRGVLGYDITYIVFKRTVVQYFNDDISDANGNCSTLYQEIAKHIFGEDTGVFFCTDVKANLGDEEVPSLGVQAANWP